MNPCIVHKFYVTTETIARVETRSGDVLNNEESAGRRRATEINDPRSHGHRRTNVQELEPLEVAFGQP